MRLHRFLDFFPLFVEKLGVEYVEDLQLVTEADLPLLGIKPVQARRLLHDFSIAGSHSQQLQQRFALPTPIPASSALTPPGPIDAAAREVGANMSGQLAFDATGTASSEPGDVGSDEIDYSDAHDQ